MTVPLSKMGDTVPDTVPDTLEGYSEEEKEEATASTKKEAQ
jgi:hypothetical protein